jgi:hypothetical protein
VPMLRCGLFRSNFAFAIVSYLLDSDSRPSGRHANAAP